MVARVAGHGMSESHAGNLSWFNPRQMSDDAVRALSVGRAALAEHFFRDLRQRLAQPAGGLHWLVTGGYGAGKSYFLRLVQSLASRRLPAPAPGEPPAVRIVLLPEELTNVRAPHDLIDEIRRLRRADGGGPAIARRAATWRDDDPAAAWAAALAALWAEADESLLVVGIENLGDLLGRAFGDEVSASLLRTLLLHEPRLMLLASAVDASADQHYGQRLFRQFQHHPLPGWDVADHRRYLALRAAQAGQTVSDGQRARISAYSRFTGGNPRVAALLADALLDSQDLVAAGDDLNTVLDWLTKYYTGQLAALPANSALLFDALVGGGGEPASQTEVAERVKARQADISRAFGWLVDHGLVSAERQPGAKETLYRASDRLFVQWYRMRYVEPGVRPALAVMTELIADTVGFADKWRYALRLDESGRHADAQVFAELGLAEVGVSWQRLIDDGMRPDQVMDAAQRVYLAPKPGDTPHHDLDAPLLLLERHRSDHHFVQALATSYRLVAARERAPGMAADGARLAALVKSSLSLSPAEKLHVLNYCSGSACSPMQWDELVKTFVDEQAEFDRLKPSEEKIIQALQVADGAGWRKTPLAFSWLSICRHLLRERSNLRQSLESEFSASVLAFTAAANAALHLRRSVAQARPLFFEFSGSLRNFVGTPRPLPDLVDTALHRGASTEVDSVLQRLIAAWPRHRRKADAADLARLWTERSLALCDQQAWADAADAAMQALARCTPADNAHVVVAVASSQLGWARGEQGLTAAAITAHDAAVAAWLHAGHPNACAWPLGQAARQRAVADGAAAALAHLVDAPPLSGDALHKAWQQLADAVRDVARDRGHAEAFALGRTLLAAGLQHPAIDPARLLRLWAIDGIGMALPFDLLGELVAEATHLPLADRSAHASALAQTQSLLQDWLAELQRTPDQRDALRRRQDPDRVLTWRALEAELPMATRVRLGLASPPTLSPPELALYQRMLALLV